MSRTSDRSYPYFSILEFIFVNVTLEIVGWEWLVQGEGHKGGNEDIIPGSRNFTEYP